MKLSRMYDRLERMPLLKVLVPFAGGILLADYVLLPGWFTAAAFIVAGAMALLLRSSVCAATMLVAAGFGVAALHGSETAVPRGVHTVFEVVVGGIPTDRSRYTAADGTVAAWRDPISGHWYPAADRILLRADTLTPLSGGERLRCRGTIRPLRGGPESYRRLMARRGFAGTLWLSERAVLERFPTRENSIHQVAVSRMEALGVGGDAGGVVLAMTAGDRSGITPELRKVYSRSGLSHLLAVSGLHMGIVFLLVNLALWWLPLLRRGHLIRNALSVAAVWLFAAAAGFPPSAVRAAVMCTALQFALATGSEYAGLNALGGAAFGMLLWNPAWLGDIGFQLSFAAVGAILAWGVPLCRLLRIREVRSLDPRSLRFRFLRRCVNALVAGLVVSAAATVATAPLVSYAFGIIPLAGVMVNPAAILLATAVVFAGAVWLVLPFAPLATPLRFVAQKGAEGIGALARCTASVPGGVVECGLTTAQTAVIYLLFAAATLVVWCREPKKSVHLPR